MTHKHGVSRRYVAGCEGCKTAARAYYEAHKRRIIDRNAARFARQLEAGIQIASVSHHHDGMAVLKGPRPEGMTLSLVNPWSPSAYWGHNRYRGQRRPCRLSTDPNDYVWESQADNMRRGFPALMGGE